jgi:hypothetical protein
MRQIATILITVSLVAPGCHRGRQQAPPPGAGATSKKGAGPNQKVITTPDTGLSGKVARVNASGRFAVLNFPVGHLPAIDQRLDVYRLGLKTGEIRVTGPQRDDNIVGDVIAGEVQPGDEVRDR